MKAAHITAHQTGGTGKGYAPVILKKAESRTPELKLPSARLQHEKPPQSTIKKLSRSDYENIAFLHRAELERILKLAVPYKEKPAPHFIAEKGNVLDVFA
ncbi:MAG: hypothetical protein OEZ34_02895 [Spirochaetia bacterium]|nr:hypothetical protein [Spirochaetia bacterium]